MKKMNRSKLTLNRETLRTLSSDKLSLMIGGATQLNCYPTINNCVTGACFTSAACPPESNNCTTGSAGCNEN